MTWPKSRNDSSGASIFAYMLTIIAFCAVVAIADLVTPYISYYYTTGSFPDSDASSAILDNLQADAWPIVLSSVVGLALMITAVVVFRFGRFFSVFITLIEFTALYLSLDLFVSWIMWKYDPTNNSTVLTMIPYLLMQLCIIVVLELGAILGQGGRAGSSFVALGCLLGAFVGIIRSTEQSYFYPTQDGNFLEDSNDLGRAFGNSILDTLFFFSSSAIVAGCIARSKIGGSVLWHLVGFVLTVGLACAFSMYATISDYLPVISSEAARYTVGAIVAVVTLIIAYIVYRPIHTRRPKQVEEQRFATQRPRGPIPANAVVMV